MKIAIAGASGQVGGQIVPRLIAGGAELLLVGRNATRLAAMFPDCKACTYDLIEEQAAGYDSFIYLAAINNDQVLDYAAYKAVNVDLALVARDAARRAQVRGFVYLSSTHALDDRITTSYARSKREAAIALQNDAGTDTIIIHMPALIGEFGSGRLGRLGRAFPKLTKLTLPLLKSLKPTVSAETLTDALTEIVTGSVAASEPLLVSDGQRGNRLFSIAKRTFDTLCALAVVVFLWWAMLLIWVLIKLQSPGPGIFRQVRIGRGGVPFTCYKFRTMHASAPNIATHLASAAMVTPLGAFLRRTKLDEIPQVVNILAGQMSLVGPRPCLPSQLELLEARRSQGILDILPGVTGLAQVNGIDMSDPTLLTSWDERYLRLQSLMLDLQILVRTALGSGSGDRIQR